jgi:hypothetical protein
MHVCRRRSSRSPTHETQHACESRLRHDDVCRPNIHQHRLKSCRMRAKSGSWIRRQHTCECTQKRSGDRSPVPIAASLRLLPLHATRRAPATHAGSKISLKSLEARESGRRNASPPVGAVNGGEGGNYHKDEGGTRVRGKLSSCQAGGGAPDGAMAAGSPLGP